MLKNNIETFENTPLILYLGVSGIWSIRRAPSVPSCQRATEDLCGVLAETDDGMRMTLLIVCFEPFGQLLLTPMLK